MTQKLVVGDFNARHPRFDNMGKINNNGVKLIQFLQDIPSATLLENNVQHISREKGWIMLA